MSYDRARGHSTEYDVVELGFNYRLDDIRAALGLAQFNRLAADRSRRRDLRNRYVALLSSLTQITVPFRDASEEVSNYIMPVVLNEECHLERDTMRQILASRGIQTSVHYPAVHRFSAFAPFSRELPLTEYYADRTLTLPLYFSLGDEEVDEICQVIATSLSQTTPERSRDE
jgi:dTDP-4-amino-4,6-dideoxygalactose transaminase